MLALGRKVGESVMIGDDIVVSVAEIKGGYVVLAFDAPKDVKIHRMEVYRRIQAEEGHHDGA